MKIRTKLFQILIFLILLMIGLHLLYRIFFWKDTSGLYYSSTEQLYSMEKDVVDVAFFGPSTIYTSINPAIFWEKDGIAVFNAAVSGQDRSASLYYLKELLKYQSPKVVVLSATYFFFDIYGVQGNLIRNALSLKASPNSFALINDLISKNPEAAGEITRNDFLLRWPIFHSRYRELQEADFVPVKEYENCLGYVYNTDNGTVQDLEEISFDTAVTTPISEENRQWIDELKELSEEHGFQILILSAPYGFSDSKRACVNGCFSYLDEVGIPHLDLNFCLNEMGFVPSFDMPDIMHYNFRGARKISEYLSNYLKENYELPDRRGQAGYERFDLCLENYNHKCLELEILPAADILQLIELPKTYRNLLISVTVHPGSSPNPEILQLLEAYGVASADTSSGGTWLWEDHRLLHSPSPEQYAYKIDPGKYYYIRPTAIPGADLITIGSEVYTTPEAQGTDILIYDTLLNKLIAHCQFE